MQFELQLQPPSIMVIGPPGSGKTDALATLLASELETFVIATEPDGIASLLDSCARRKIPIDNLHWASCLPAAPGWTALSDMVRTIGSMGFEEIQKIKSGVGKTDTRQPAMKLLNILANFKCERTGQAFGDVTTWKSNRALVWDSLSGINLLSMMLTIGYKPAAHQGEWGVAMNFIEQLLLKTTSDRGAFFIMNAHIEKEVNELTGVSQIMVSTLGRKLAPKIPRFFSEVVLAKRLMKDGKASFTWSTVDSTVDLKNRSLPISNDLTQDYAPIVAAYRRRKDLAAAPSLAATQESAKDAPRSVVPPVAPMTRPQATT
jgi:hypothetical protein